MTNERAKLLSNILNEDADRANKLVALEPAVAIEKINALGYDFTVEELVAYGKALAASQGKVEDEALSGVAGGAGQEDMDANFIIPIVILPKLVAPVVWSIIRP